jgi:tellurite resistance protein TerC
MSVPVTAWLLLIGFVLAMLLIDLFLHRQQDEIRLKESAIWSLIWVACGLGVGLIIWLQFGGEFGLQYLTAYVVEKSLAIDNVFIWGLLFSFFAIPNKYQHRVLFLGVLGALIFRAIFIGLGAAAIKEASWVLYLFGAFLVLTGIKMFMQKDSHLDLNSSRFYRLMKRRVRLSDELDGNKFFTRKNGIRYATPLFLALLMVEFMDLVFAVDSIPAVFAVTEEPFLVFASNALAILGLRAMYFLLVGLMERLIYLKAGLSIILVWVGLKMIISHAFFEIPTFLSLAVIAITLAITVVSSLKKTKVAK